MRWRVAAGIAECAVIMATAVSVAVATKVVAKAAAARTSSAVRA